MRRISLSVLIPTILFLISLFVQGLLLWHSMYVSQTQLVQYTQSGIVQVTQKIEQSFPRSPQENFNSNQVANAFNLGLYQESIRSITLFDRHHQRVMSRPLPPNQASINQQIFSQALQAKQSIWDKQDHGLLGTLYVPVTMDLANLKSKYNYLLVIHYDLRSRWQLWRTHLFTLMKKQLFGIVAVLLLLALFIRIWLEKPIRSLTVHSVRDNPLERQLTTGQGIIADLRAAIVYLRDVAANSLTKADSAEQRWKFALDTEYDGFWEWNLQTNQVTYTPQWGNMLKVQIKDLPNNLYGWKQFIHEDDRQKTLEAFDFYLQGKSEVFDCNHRLVRSDGEIIWVATRAKIVDYLCNEPLKMVASFRNITELRRTKEQLLYRSNYDSITQLANRSKLFQELELAISKHEHSHKYGGLLYLDIDNFKNVNDLFGYHVGDVILKRVADRLQKNQHPHIQLEARISGDEFAVLVTNLSEQRPEAVRQLLVIAHQLRRQLSQPMEIQNSEINFGLTVGIALFPHHNDRSYEIFRQADMALYHGKDIGRSGVHFFIEEMANKVHKRHEIQMLMQKGMHNCDMVLYYQPRFDTHFKVVGAETLLRWFDPQYGWISPGTFIPLAEDSGFIVELSDWILRGACQALKRWQDRGLPEQFKTLSVNVSPKQFHRSRFVQDIVEAVKESGCDPNLLELEITEGVLVSNVDDTIKKLSTLRQMGIRFSIDDFGTGYSSLAYLNRLPINCLKIDKSFVDEVVANNVQAGSKAIIATIIAMSENLGLDVVAEGVETNFQMDFLKYRGCEIYQGFLFSQALEPDIFEKLIFEGAKVH